MITITKTWWRPFFSKTSCLRLRLATHPSSDLLFKGCWSGSQHVLPSRERDLTGEGRKTFTPAKGTVRLPAVVYRGKTHQEYSEVKKSSLLLGWLCCFGIWLPPITTKSCSQVSLWYTLIYFRSPVLKPRKLPESDTACANKTELCFIGKEIILPGV